MKSEMFALPSKMVDEIWEEVSSAFAKRGVPPRAGVVLLDQFSKNLAKRIGMDPIVMAAGSPTEVSEALARAAKLAKSGLKEEPGPIRGKEIDESFN